MKRLFVAGILLSFSIFLLPAQSVRPFQVQWHKSFGGTNADYPYRIAVASNGGYMIAAVSDSSTGGNKQTTNYGGSDAWFVRTDSDGNKLWERNIGGTLRDRVRDLKWTCNGQWIAVGESASSPSGNKTSPVYGESDYWIVLLDDQGNTIWEKSYGEAVTMKR